MTAATNNGSIPVVIHGATGRMGAEAVRAVTDADDLTLVGATCHTPRGDTLPTPAGPVPLSTDLASILDTTGPAVMVEFTHAEACMQAVPLAAHRGIHMVLGASGLNAAQLQTLDTLSREHGVGIIVAPNFALGAVVLKKLAEQAAAFFDYVDVVEAHHEMKIDAPSGFSLAIARGLREAHGSDFQRNETSVHHLPETRGGDEGGVGIHSLRLTGPQRPSRGDLRRRRPNPQHPPRHPGPRLLYARRAALHPRGGAPAWPDRGLGNGAGTVIPAIIP